MLASRTRVLVFPPDFLKKKTCEVQAFLKAVQLRRQDGGCYEPWDLLIGSDVRVGERAQEAADVSQNLGCGPTRLCVHR